MERNNSSRFFSYMLCLFFFHFTTAQFYIPDFDLMQPVTDDRLGWCVINSAEQAKCEQMLAALLWKGITPELRCVKGRDRFDCMEKILTHQADLVSLESGDVYIAGKFFSLVPVMFEAPPQDEERAVSGHVVAGVQQECGDVAVCEWRPCSLVTRHHHHHRHTAHSVTPLLVTAPALVGAGWVA